MKITNHSDIKRFSKIEFLVYEYVNLMALVNPAVGFLSEDAVKFFIMYSIDTYDDRNNSSYTTMNESVYTLEKRIENGDYKDNRKLLDRFNHFKQILKDTEPLYLKVNDEKKEKSRWTTITFTKNQLGKTYIANGREVCNIRLPIECNYERYALTVPKLLISESNYSNTMYFRTTENFIHSITTFDDKTKSWLKVELDTDTLKKEMHSIFKNHKKDTNINKTELEKINKNSCARSR